MTWTYEGIEVTELEGQGFEINEDSNSAVRILQTDYTENILQNFPRVMRGSHATAPGNTITREIPRVHPLHNWLYCTSLRLQGGKGSTYESTANADSGIMLYRDAPNSAEGRAIWEATYSWLPYEIRQDEEIGGNGVLTELDRFVRKEANPSVEALPIDGTAWKWSVAPQDKIAEPTTVLLSTTTLTYLWYWVPSPFNQTAWDTAIGKVNSVAFDVNEPQGNYAVGTVYFAGYEKD